MTTSDAGVGAHTDRTIGSHPTEGPILPEAPAQAASPAGGPCVALVAGTPTCPGCGMRPVGEFVAVSTGLDVDGAVVARVCHAGGCRRLFDYRLVPPPGSEQLIERNEPAPLDEPRSVEPPARIDLTPADRFEPVARPAPVATPDLSTSVPTARPAANGAARRTSTPPIEVTPLRALASLPPAPPAAPAGESSPARRPVTGLRTPLALRRQERAREAVERDAAVAVAQSASDTRATVGAAPPVPASPRSIPAFAASATEGPAGTPTFSFNRTVDVPAAAGSADEEDGDVRTRSGRAPIVVRGRTAAPVAVPSGPVTSSGGAVHRAGSPGDGNSDQGAVLHRPGPEVPWNAAARATPTRPATSWSSKTRPVSRTPETPRSAAVAPAADRQDEAGRSEGRPSSATTENGSPTSSDNTTESNDTEGAA